jgi:hypothetical protein
MPAASTIILAGAALAAAGATTYQAETARKGQKKAFRAQQAGEAEGMRMAMSEREQADMESRRMNQKTPDVAALLTGEQGAQGRGAASTLLTGNTRIGDQMDRIGKNTLLGE